MAEGLKTVASLVMGTIGLYMLIRAKKTANPRMMIWGGVLLVLSYLLFS